jgi:hypothetical protein
MTIIKRASANSAAPAQPAGAKSRWRRAHSLAAALAVGAAAFTLAPAQSASAEAVCANGSLPVSFPANTDAGLNVWDVEGKITAADVTARTITVNGMTFTVPADMLLKTKSLDQPTGNTTFADAFAGAQPTLVGGTVIANGTTDIVPAIDSVEQTPVAGSYCMNLTATSVFSEVAENLIIGPLMSVDAASESFVVNGVTVTMNKDPRFDSQLIDTGGDPLQVSDLVGHEGALIDVAGYYTATGMRGTVVEADLVKAAAGKDTVQVQRAQHASGQLRVNGVVGRFAGTGSLARSVQVWRGTVNADGTACTGALLNSAVPVAADGSFDYRQNMTATAAPTSVCVLSPIVKDTATDATIGGGGMDDLPVARK